ncbi:MAG: metallophosphoesterase [Myxococcaceae bacterium]
MPRIVHLSDVHVQLDWRQRSLWHSGWRGVPGRFELHGMGRLKRFAEAEANVRRLLEAAERRDAERVILTGDLTALGDLDELKVMRELLSPLIDAGRLFLIPGNHDRYTDSSRGRRFEQVFGDLLGSDLPEHADARGYPFVKLWGDRWAVVGLDSTRVHGWSQYVVGRVGQGQLDALSRLLDDRRLAGRSVLVLSHHGPHGPSGEFDWRESGLLDAQAFVEVLRDRPVVLMHGHSHLRYWHRAGAGMPHRLGGGSSTEPGNAGFYEIELDSHLHLEAIEHRG